MLKIILNNTAFGPLGEENCEDKVLGRVQQHFCMVGSPKINQEEVESLSR